VVREQWSPIGCLRTAATNTPNVPAPSDYDDREIDGMIAKGNRSTRKTCPSAALSTTNPTCSARTRNREAEVGSQRLTA
jgi:hypothetical protein